jgi:hypothetical protein
MSPSRRRNPGHSAFERLLNLARTRGEDFNLLLLRYGVERLLYRLSISQHADKFILKGASLFLVWKKQNYRVTKDADLLSFAPTDVGYITLVFKELCQVASEEVDGMVFVPDTVRAVAIREEQEYGGIRVTLLGLLHQARIPLQVDIGFGDAVTPEPERIEFPTLLDVPAPRMLACPRYTMVAEKLETMVRLGMANSRMKDFYDVCLLAKLFEFDGPILCEAVHNTFSRRSTPLPRGLPTAFTREFRQDDQKQTQWRAFVRRSKPEMTEDELDTVIDDVVAFLAPIVEALQNDTVLDSVWTVGGPWGKRKQCSGESP